MYYVFIVMTIPACCAGLQFEVFLLVCVRLIMQLVKREETLEKLQSEDQALQQHYEACCQQVSPPSNVSDLDVHN